MIIRSGILSSRQSRKPVEIQLALKGCQFSLPQIIGQNNFGKFFWLVNEKTTPVGLPGNNVRIPVGFDPLQDGMELHGEGLRGGARFAGTTISVLVVIIAVHIAFVRIVKGMVVIIVLDKMAFVFLETQKKERE